MLIKSLAGLSALMGALAMIDFEPAGEATIEFNVRPDGVEMIEVYEAGANNTTPVWQCDVRAWTRAPDLSPGKVLPADARLAANGSACGDIVKWEVGMRLKERALIKIKAKGVEFPVEPIRPVWNESFYAHRQNDYNDVMQSNMYYSSHQDPAEKEYDEAMSAYQEKLRNSSLWLISGQERVVYDLAREMDLGHDRSEHMDLVESFAIHMPRTNFPPIERYSGWSSGGSDQMLVTETLSEFYHLVTLANGTILDLPSGEIGIIPASSSIKPKSAVEGISIGENAWPQTVDFPPTSHNRTEKEESEYRFRYLPVAPQCDEYNAANFTLRVHSNVTQPILGQNLTLNITLTRTGNGSEYPAWINVAHATPNNITWAYQFVADDSEYSDLRDDMSMRGVRFSAHGAEPKLRMATSTRDLENEKKDKERGMDGNGRPCGCEYYGGWGDFGSPKSRYYMLEDGKEPQEEYTFGLEIALPEREIPSFEKTFERFRSSLVFTLNTYFACDTSSLDSADGSAQTGPAVSELDKEWDTYALPTRECKRSKILTHGNMYSHTKMVPLDARLDPALTGATGSDEASAGVVHYLDDAALSPMLSASVQDAVTFSPLNQAVRDEKEHERKRSRWGPGMRGRQRGWCERENASPRCWDLNGGGADKVASTMWQSKMAKEKEMLGSRGDDVQPPVDMIKDHRFVLQA